MAKKNIISVDFEFPGGITDYSAFDNNISLLDADIIVFNPNISHFTLYASENYQGKPSLSESRSFELKERLNHWRKELIDAYNSGKTIFFFLEELQEVFIDTGRRNYSGTGRNKQKTIIVEKINNYGTLPFDISVRDARGSKILLNNETNILRNYWEKYSGLSSYKVVIEDKVSKKLLTTKDNQNILGALLKHKTSNGHFLLLPSLNIDEDKFLKLRNGEYYWSKEATIFGNNLQSIFLEIDASLKAQSENTPKPQWLSNENYELKIEKKYYEKMDHIENELTRLTKEKEEIRTQLEKELFMKNLLFENGKPLEHSVLDSLTLLGFKATNYKESDKEFDVVFEAEEGRFLGEVEGKDSKAINVDKLRQLEMNIHEDLSRDEVEHPAKSVLFGNAFRLVPLEERSDFFTEKCKIAALRSNTALIRTTDLFFISKYLKEKKDIRFAKKCREAIFKTSGKIVEFPKIPKGKTKTKKFDEANT